ncbi:hypothetical protein [Burkholderia sp. LMU1-1-1.1]|uniref:hypothetical protein n=1 Tax=Burkholderia sp. LMU1-1-1.1 TaxID=3135266 RepID=UPI00344831BD
MTAATTTPPRARKKPAAEPLRLVVDSLSAEDKELLRYFHAIAHEVRGHMLDIVRQVSVSKPLVAPDSAPAATGLRLVTDADARRR